MLILMLMLFKLAYQPSLMVGRLRTRPHAPATELTPLDLPACSVLDLWPAATGAPEAVSFYILDKVVDLLAWNGQPTDPPDAIGGEVLDYTLLCVSRAHWRAVSRWREPAIVS